jgi:hypothetical protein
MSLLHVLQYTGFVGIQCTVQCLNQLLPFSVTADSVLNLRIVMCPEMMIPRQRMTRMGVESNTLTSGVEPNWSSARTAVMGAVEFCSGGSCKEQRHCMPFTP